MNRRRYDPLRSSQWASKQVRHWSNRKSRIGRPRIYSNRRPPGYIHTIVCEDYRTWELCNSWNTSPRLRFTSSEVRVWEFSDSWKQLRPIVRSVEYLEVAGGRPPSSAIRPSEVSFHARPNTQHGRFIPSFVHHWCLYPFLEPSQSSRLCNLAFG